MEEGEIDPSWDEEEGLEVEVEEAVEERDSHFGPFVGG